MMELQEVDVKRCNHDTFKRPSHFFNSYFMERLLLTNKKYCYEEVHRWSKKLDIFKKSMLYFPINISNTHWTLLIVFMQMKQIHYYDSKRGKGSKYLKAIKRWIMDEAIYKKKISDYNMSEWNVFDCESNVPLQENDVDCGVFALLCADFISDRLPLSYTQGEICFFRRKIAADILRGSLLYDIPQS